MASTISFGKSDDGFGAGGINGPIRATLHHTSAQPEPPPQPSIVIPFARDADFVERGTILEDLHRRCTAPDSWTALVGLGGIGKSQLAIEHAYRTREASPETWVLWAHGSSASRLEQSFRDIADCVKIAGRQDPQANISKLVHDWLRDSKERWLLVLDNVDDAGYLNEALGVGTLYRWYIPHCEHGSVLVTTRNAYAALKLVEQRDIISLLPMSEEQAQTLLERKLGVRVAQEARDSKETIAELTTALGCIPLAVVQAAAYISQRAPTCSVAQYLDQLRKSERERTSLLNRDGGQLRRDHEVTNSIITTWQISFEHIRQTRPSAADLLSLMSFFDRQGIPEELLRSRGKQKGGNISQHEPSAEAAHNIEEDEALQSSASDDESGDDTFEDDVMTLRCFSFISVEAGGTSFKMHALVQLATRTWLVANGQHEKWKHQFISNLSAAFPTGAYENWAVCGPLFAHAKAAAEQRPEGEVLLAEWATLLYRAAWYACQTGSATEAEQLAVECLKTRQKVLGQEHEDTWWAMTMVSHAYSIGGQWDMAEKLQQQVVEKRKAKLGHDHPDTLTSMGNLALTYRYQDQWEKAKELQEQVLKVHKAMLGDNHPDTLTSMGNLALTYTNQGRWEDAEGLQVEVLKTSKIKPGDEHPHTLTSMADLALTYTNQGRWEDAVEKLQVELLKKRMAMLGDNHPDTLSSMASLASTYQSQGQWNKAEELEMQLEECKIKLGKEHRSGGDSESISDVSDMPSLFSATSSLESRSSAGLLGDIGLTATQYLASLLSQDPLLGPLYIQALAEFGAIRFSRNHDRLLKKFLADLKSESTEHVQLQAVRFLQNRSRREQVTAQICQYSRPYSNPAERQSMQRFLEQEEDRHYGLDRFLRERNETADKVDRSDSALGPKKDGFEDPERIIGKGDGKEEDEDEEEDEEEDEDSGSETEEAQTEKLPHLESVVAFLTSGPSFQAFKSSLDTFVNPPTTIGDALKSGSTKVLRQLLRKRFELATRGEYSWVRELDELGYTRDEIAELLFEQADDAPWIYFTPTTFGQAAVSTGLHLHGCVHQFLPADQALPGQPSTLNLGRSPSGTWQSVIRIVEELCGLGGISPTTRDMEKWDGSVTFQEQNSVALVTSSQFVGNVDMKHQGTISRLRNSLERFCQAAGHVQAAGLSCDSFTILSSSSLYANEPLRSEGIVELCQIEFQLPLQLLSELETLSAMSDISSIDIRNLEDTALRILRPFNQGTTTSRCGNSLGEGLQLCSFAVQVLCLGFVSYSQAHAGCIRPFFLDTPLARIRLLGNRRPSDEHACIEASLKDLTCIGEMIRSRVLTFSLVQPRTQSFTHSEEPRYNIRTNIHDLLDTWGPARILIQRTSKMLIAIEIGNGIVYASDLDNNKFHWSKDVDFECLSQVAFDPLNKMVIGASVIVNEDCTIDAKSCWTSSSAYLEPLGPYRVHWDQDERQFGVQAGNYAMIQAIAASHKLPGQTLKQHRLQQDDEMLIPFLDDLWGVQVSFCTHIARRVPLREMVADLLPIFAGASITSCDETQLWQDLLKLDIMGAFQRNEIRDWLIKLSPQLYQQVLRMVRRIFAILRHTGLDREGRNLLIAWPQEREIFRCFKVPCEKESSWAGVLADSEDSATFAYITTKCFETKTIKCSGPSAAWQGTIPLLETAVVLHARDSTTLPTVLQHDATYFFQKLDHLFFVKVQKQDPIGVTNLITSRSRSPPDIQRRLLVRIMEDRKRRARLRERIAADDIAENVAVSH